MVKKNFQYTCNGIHNIEKFCKYSKLSCIDIFSTIVSSVCIRIMLVQIQNLLNNLYFGGNCVERLNKDVS